MNKANIAFEIDTKKLIVPTKEQIEDEEMSEDLIMRADCKSIDEFIDIHDKMKTRGTRGI